MDLFVLLIHMLNFVPKPTTRGLDPTSLVVGQAYKLVRYHPGYQRYYEDTQQLTSAFESDGQVCMSFRNQLLSSPWYVIKGRRLRECMPVERGGVTKTRCSLITLFTHPLPLQRVAGVGVLTCSDT